MSGVAVYVLYYYILTAAHAVSAIQTLVTGAAADSNMAAGVTGGCVTLHRL